MEFNHKLNLDLAEELIRFDEVERAITVLQSIPAHLRDVVPKDLQAYKDRVNKSLCTTHAYMMSDCDSEVSEDRALVTLRTMLRGMLIEKEVTKYNAAMRTPHIVDMGPGEYFIPIGLKNIGAKITYDPISIDRKAFEVAEPIIDSMLVKPIEGSPIIFVACEVIEHLFHVEDLSVECQRHCPEKPERIHLSTPKYTYDVTPKDWKKPCGLPHLRAYTPNEFLNAAIEIFPGYAWQLYDSPILSLRGTRNDIIDKEPLI